MTKCFISVDERLSVTIDLFDHSVAQKFLQELRWHMANGSIDNQEAFYNYADEATVRQDLLAAIDTVNVFLKRRFIELPLLIDWESNDTYNYIHEKFEQLNGTWNHPTRLLTIAPTNIKKAIRMINFAVHRLERRPYKIHRSLYLSWDKNSYQRQYLTDQEHECFDNIMRPNTAYLNYVEVGKNLVDLYHDGLDPAYSGYENLHFVGAELTMDFECHQHDMFDEGFRKWATKHSIDVNDKRLGIGKIPIGTFEGSDNFFTKDSKITSITIEE